MSNLQIKNVPADLHARLRERATAAGISMRDYVLRAIEHELRMDGLDEWLDEAGSLGPLDPGASRDEIVELVRQAREERAEQILGALPDRLPGGE